MGKVTSAIYKKEDVYTYAATDYSFGAGLKLAKVVALYANKYVTGKASKSLRGRNDYEGLLKKLKLSKDQLDSILIFEYDSKTGEVTQEIYLYTDTFFKGNADIVEMTNRYINLIHAFIGTESNMMRD